MSARIWERACFDLPVIFKGTPDKAQRAVNTATSTMAAWFSKRQSRIKQLGLKGLVGSVQLPPAVTSMLIMTQAASLTHLSIDVSPSGLSGPELGVLATVKGLVELLVHVSGHGLSDCGAAVIRAASVLTSLQRLKLMYVKQPGSEYVELQDVGLPRCKDLAVLSSNSLTKITVVMDNGTGDTLRLVGVRNLQKCRLLGYAASTAEFRIQSTSFAGCTGLVELTLCHMRGLTLQAGCLRAMSALSKLTLSNCGLLAVPADVAQLTALRCLDLRNNRDLGIDETEISMLRKLKKLRVLKVAHDAVTAFDAPMKRQMQALFDLTTAFHSEGLQLDVQIDPASAEQTYKPAYGHFGILRL